MCTHSERVEKLFPEDSDLDNDDVRLAFLKEVNPLQLLQQESCGSSFEFDGPDGSRHRLGPTDHVIVDDGWLLYTQPKNGNEHSFWRLKLPGTTTSRPSDGALERLRDLSSHHADDFHHGCCLLTLIELHHDYS